MQSAKLERAQSNLVGQFRSRTSFISGTRPKKLLGRRRQPACGGDGRAFLTSKLRRDRGITRARSPGTRLNVHSFNRSFAGSCIRRNTPPFLPLLDSECGGEARHIRCAIFKIRHLCSPALVDAAGIVSSNQIYIDCLSFMRCALNLVSIPQKKPCL